MEWLLMVLYFTVPTPHNENGHPIPYYKWGQYVSSQEERARLAHDVLAIKLRWSTQVLLSKIAHLLLPQQ